MSNEKVPAVITKAKSTPLEKAVEARFKKVIRKLGGDSFKFTSPQRRSVTDQVMILDGRVIFVEVKRDGCRMTPKQVSFGETILARGGEHACVVGHSGVDAFIAHLTGLPSFLFNEIAHYE